MPLNMDVTTRVKTEDRTVEGVKTYSNEQRKSLSVSIPDGSTDMLVSETIDVSQVKVFILKSDRNISFQTNNPTSPVNTINLVANVPYLWTTDSYDTFKLTSDVTAIYLTNASGASAQLEMEALLDSTP